MRWIASDGNQELLAAFAPYLTVKSLLHLNIDFNAIPGECEMATVERWQKDNLEPDKHLTASWIGIGGDLGTELGESYKLSVYEAVQEDEIVVEDPIALMKRIRSFRG